MSTTLRILDREAVRNALPMTVAIGLMKTAFVEISAGHATIPPRMNIEVPEHDARFLLMPVYAPAADQFALKLLSLFKGNPERGLPFIHSVLILVDGSDGRPLALMDAEYLTALRTGAASGLATDLLARKEASTVLIVGAGAQGRLQLEGISSVRRITTAYIMDSHPERVSQFVDELHARAEYDVRQADSTTFARKVDIICTATTSSTPVLADRDIRAGTHINAIGAYRPEMQEIPPATVQRSRVVVDQRSSVLEEAGEIVQGVKIGILDPGALTELGEIVAGTAEGRRRDDEITLFKSVGNAAQDLFAAREVYRRAEEVGLGVTMEL